MGRSDLDQELLERAFVALRGAPIPVTSQKYKKSWRHCPTCHQLLKKDPKRKLTFVCLKCGWRITLRSKKK